MLDEMIANLILIVRNQAVGRFLTKQGALDMEQILPIHGLNIEINEPHTIEDVKHLPPDQIPPVIFEFVQWVTQLMMDMVPSLSETFAGDSPHAGASGRAIASLQYANFSQLSDNIRGMNAFRMRRARQKISLVQQFARRPAQAHLWRGGLDLKDPFPEEARFIGYHINIPDSTALPNTPAGKLQFIQILAQLGRMPKDPLEMLGLTKGYGWKADDFIEPMPPMVGPGGQPINEQAAVGAEPAPPIER